MQSFSQEQIDYLSAMHFINRVDSHLRVVSNVKVVANPDGMPPRVVLLLDLLYDNQRVDILSFDLHDHAFDEIVEVARNIGDNEYIMYEIDNHLAGHGE